MLTLIKFMIRDLEIFVTNTEVLASYMKHRHVCHRLVALGIVR